MKLKKFFDRHAAPADNDRPVVSHRRFSRLFPQPGRIYPLANASIDFIGLIQQFLNNSDLAIDIEPAPGFSK